jgi:hypothetical protein
VISTGRKTKREVWEKERWVGEKNNKERKVVVGVFIIIKNKNNKKN